MILPVMKAYTIKWPLESGFTASLMSKILGYLFTAYCFLKTSTSIYHVYMYYSIYQFLEKQPRWYRWFSSIWHLALRWRHNERESVWNHQHHDCLLIRLFRRRSKKTSKFRVTGLCEGNSPGTGEFPAQMASYAENVSIWWRHHGFNKNAGPFPCWLNHRKKSVLHTIRVSYYAHVIF